MCGPTISDHTKQHCRNKRSMITPEAWTPVIINTHVYAYFYPKRLPNSDNHFAKQLKTNSQRTNYARAFHFFLEYELCKSTKRLLRPAFISHVEFELHNRLLILSDPLSIAFWNSVTLFLFCFCFLLLCHCVTRSCQFNHFLIGLQIIRFYA